MHNSGKSLVAGQWLGGDEQGCFYSFFPASNGLGDQPIYAVTPAQVTAAGEAADEAFKQYRQTSAKQRAEFLVCIGEQIMELGDELLNVTHLETGLPMARLQGERSRTVNQLKAFADGLLKPLYEPIEESAQPERLPLPKPATRLSSLPLGPVAVFGASNFPYAFSTLGGDTASALSAGCPVIVKGHPAHPLTSEMMAMAMEKAIKLCHMPVAVFSLLQSNNPSISHALVGHPLVKAVGFTGSYQVASQLQQTIYQREEVIPFYGELGSINPQIVLPEKVQQDGPELAQQLCQALLMGNGQFCTSPGLWIVPSPGTEFVHSARDFLQQQGSDSVLTPGIANSYVCAVEALAINSHLKDLASSKVQQDFHVPARLFQLNAADFIKNKQLHQEIFGPCALIVTYDDQNELLSLVNSLSGQLTASIHGTNSELASAAELVENLRYKVGRLIFNQMPTGVEVCASMNHGGPYPASTDVRSTSVGLMAMQRFLRPICYQNLPVELSDI
ncbi:aldehyde dehydrogenase (NADP(+)) [Paraglaciecola arctica]|uniref:NADP-dependent aldehyde dehydrogenase n=1 Tax=Paraglaciecola arctica BSs20135 TaxID=493475 RepID=K6YQH0_9ALTE|nr:aldehyde dehydrogenase (NADP(+)) [Paraglaciecola arctica]GAC18858.1 NADP-dependent aldehyde dehydrogenase [Paraglaciecola arctica BSs20135]